MLKFRQLRLLWCTTHYDQRKCLLMWKEMEQIKRNAIETSFQEIILAIRSTSSNRMVCIMMLMPKHSKQLRLRSVKPEEMKINSSFRLSKPLSIPLQLIITEEQRMSVYIIHIADLLILTEMMKNPVQTQSFNKQTETRWLISIGQLNKNTGITKDDSENKLYRKTETLPRRRHICTANTHAIKMFWTLWHLKWRLLYYSLCVSVCAFC